MQDRRRTVLVTGSNKGIGYTLVQQLIKTPRYKIIMTSRDRQLGLQSYSTIKTQNPLSEVVYMQLDITSQQSITELYNQLVSEGMVVDVLVNNAAVGYDEPYQIPEINTAELYFACNYFGTVNFTRRMMDRIAEDAKVINVSSRMGALDRHSQQVRERLLDPSVTEGDLEACVQEYLEGCKNRTLKGWYWSSYGTSKTLLNIWSISILKTQLKRDQSVLLMSPGFCLTDMVKNSIQDQRTKTPVAKSPEEGVRTLMFCIEEVPFGSEDSGKFYYNCNEWDIHRSK